MFVIIMEKTMEKKNKKIKFLGMRVIKTVIAVYLCFLISFIRKTSPFYSAIASILCMQNSHDNSFKVGKNRMIGTIIGGLYGLLVIVGIDYINVELFSPIYYLILSLFLIPIIYTNVYCKTASSTYISCVVFLSITVSHIGDASPTIFALNRIIDTLIGILISLLINKTL
ncbi:FUSC family protein [Anaerosalibacter sp. Marseille-P3206]|uniref:FUSC family protein n=1 Tax=Anaerosalibacter sp. Marseille-P3206 TaxID=1871005 RepID=UPI00190E66AF|nr:FUSC family protein [Anaerosalibacter sp. Marseille-P3206]